MDKEVIEKYKESGRIAATALKHGADMIKVGVKLVDVCDAVEDKIRELGGEPAFPAQTSRNEIAAHYCPEEDDETVYEKGDVATLDCGAVVDGYVSDTATTIDLGSNSELIQASKDALEAALKLIKPGARISEIGAAIEKAIEARGFSPVRNLSGHGIGQFIVHQAPSIPNFDSGNDQTLKEGMAIAIEPFASAGAGMIYESGNPTVFMQIARRPIRSQYARAILKDIEAYNGLPFALRWLTRKHGVGKTKIGIKELTNAGIIKGFPPLPDVKHGLVSQAEHSVLVLDEPIVITRL
ncbi:MAG: type II methionyl aminopeptidase [archaeon]